MTNTLPGRIELGLGYDKESKMTTAFLNKMRHEDKYSFRWKVPDSGNSIKPPDIFYFSNTYGGGMIELKMLDQKKEVAYEDILSRCEPHQVNILYRIFKSGHGTRLGGYNKQDGILYLFPYTPHD